MTPAAQVSPVVPQAARRYDIDALRVGAVLLLIYFHTACVFMDGSGFHIQNLERSRAATLLVVFLGQWHMPLFFLLAGASTWLALDHRSGWQYLNERFRRLFVPLLFGILVVIPPQIYVERISNWVPTRWSPIDFQGSYLAFYPHFFNGVYPKGNFSWHHLWFVAYLFVYSVVTLPLVLWLKKRPPGRRLMCRLADLLAPGRRIFLFSVPVIVLNILLQPLFPATHALIDDWCLHAQYLFVFLCGGLLLAEERVMAAVVRNRRLALALAAALTAIRLGTGLPRGLQGWTAYLVATIVFGFAATCWLILILGYGRVWLDRPLPLLRYASRIAYPFYILHQTVIIVLAYFVLRWDAGPAAKYLMISTAALLVTVGLCDGIRRMPVARFLFGMPAGSALNAA